MKHTLYVFCVQGTAARINQLTCVCVNTHVCMYASSEPYLPLFLHTINRNKGLKKKKKSIILHFKYANTPQKTLAVEQNISKEKYKKASQMSFSLSIQTHNFIHISWKASNECKAITLQTACKAEKAHSVCQTC